MGSSTFPYAAMLAGFNSLGLRKDWCCQESQFAVLTSDRIDILQLVSLPNQILFG